MLLVPIVHDTPLLPLQSSFGNTRQQLAVCACNLASDPEARAVLMDKGFVRTVVAVAQANDEVVKPACAHALHSLSMVKGKEERFVAEGAVQSLMILALFRTDNEETKSMCASALFNLMQSNACRAALVKEGVVWALVKLSEGKTYVVSVVELTWHPHGANRPPCHCFLTHAHLPTPPTGP